MKIRSIATKILRVPLGDRQFYSSQAAFPERNSLLVRIETDNGLVGWGEGGQYGPPEPVAACINHVLAPKLLGRDPTEPVRIWEELYAFSRDFGQKGTYVEAISALDIALWDIAGQAAGLPVWKMLGGRFRSSVAAYATGCYYPERFDDLASLLRALEDEASSYCNAGFSLLKIKVGLLSIEQDIERLRVIRQAVGPGIGILVDANHAYTPASAIRMGRKMEPFDVRFFEEPVVPEDRDGYRLVRQLNPIPVAGGECEFTRYGFRDLIAGGCVDIAQPDLAVCGGFTAWSHILTLANTYGVSLIPHVWGSGIAVAAALHAVATIPPNPHTANPVPLQNEPVLEFDRKHNPLRDELLDQTFTLVGGRIAIPDQPGLGVTVREDTLARFTAR
jgi:D-galactarolactone cycloisomerase